VSQCLTCENWVTCTSRNRRFRKGGPVAGKNRRPSHVTKGGVLRRGSLLRLGTGKEGGFATRPDGKRPGRSGLDNSFPRRRSRTLVKARRVMKSPVAATRPRNRCLRKCKELGSRRSAGGLTGKSCTKGLAWGEKRLPCHSESVV